jgi:signal transduction histidine kinase
MTSQDELHPATPRAARPWLLAEQRRVTLPVSIAVLVAACVGVGSALPGHQPGTIAAAVACLAVATAGTWYIFWPRLDSVRAEVAAMLAIGLAGSVLGALLPNTPGFVLVYLALAALGMRLPPRPAALAALIVLAAMNAAFITVGLLPAVAFASQNIGAVFLFTTGAFVRASELAQEEARSAQARAEELLTQLRASQAAQAEAAALTERTRLAREIHDILAHALSGLVLALDTMELLGRQARTDPAALDQLLANVTRSQRMARDGLADTKRAISALRGDELPGAGLLDRLVRDSAAGSGITAGLAVTGTRRPLPPEVGLALYRTAQEALTNTAKYAGAGARAQLRLSYAADTVELSIEDARPAGVPATMSGLTFGGFGLTGMRERAELLGGSLTAGPTERGFGVRLRLPTGRGPARPPQPGQAPGRMPGRMADSSGAPS